MRYSLLSRFHGALLGAALGEEIGFYAQKPNIKQHRISLSHWRPGQSALEQGSLEQGSLGQGGLGQGGRENPSLSWRRNVVNAWVNSLLAHGGPNGCVLKPLVQMLKLENRAVEKVTAGDWAIATLPLILFLHDSDVKLRHMLGQMVEASQPDKLAELLAFGFAIAQLLQERFDPLHLIPQTITDLEQASALPNSGSDLLQRLDQAHHCLLQRADLQTAIAHLLPAGKLATPGGTTALAFYCFLSTPEDARLTLLRAARTGAASPTVAALAGAFTGAYNSVAAIPLEWRMELGEHSQPADSSPPLHLPPSFPWGTAGEESEKLATRLFASWSGVYDAASVLSNVPAIAAAGVIRPR